MNILQFALQRYKKIRLLQGTDVFFYAVRGMYGHSACGRFIQDFRQGTGKMQYFLKMGGRIETEKPAPLSGTGFPLWVGGELLSHGLPQYHRRGGA